eukprot:scaffold10708_cov117-Isochrysis_galbana.AAC.2
MQHGSTKNNFKGGRPSDFYPRCWDQMVKVICAGREEQQKRALSRSIEASLKKLRAPLGKRAPSRETVRGRKHALGFKRQKKPRLSTKLWEQRLAMAKARRRRSDKAYIKANERTVFADEKWFSEEKATGLTFEARDDSPVAPEHRFIPKDHETKTQQVKIMYLLAVTSNRKIGCYELDFVKWNSDQKQKTKAGKDAKGITADFILHAPPPS